MSSLETDAVNEAPSASELPPRARVTMADIEALGEQLFGFQSRVMSAVHKPAGEKASPLFNATQLAALCGRSPDAMMRLIEKAGDKSLPEGHSGSTGRTRSFTVAEARAWVRALAGPGARPEGKPGATVTVANFKGGVGKTVVSMSVAQGLSLRGYKVLCIDFDPQGSLTTLFGISPMGVREEETVLPLMYERGNPGASDMLQGSIRSTYWDGVDLIPANQSLFSGEFYLPLRQMRSRRRESEEPDFWFFEVLGKALDQGIRQAYDFIIIDTPPALSYMTMTTVWAADALLLPLPPEGIDFMSSAQYWSMLSELATGTTGGTGVEKSFAWVGVVASKVDATAGQTMHILKWMRAAYSDKLLSAEIPDTVAVKVGGLELRTVYDISKYVGSQKTLVRARTAFDKLVDEVAYLTRSTLWA